MKSKKNLFRVAIVGSTGAVGQKLLSILAERAFPVLDLRLFASPRSEGKQTFWKGQEWSCQVLKPGCFEEMDFVFFDASDAVSKKWVPEALQTGAWVIDNSAAFRLDPHELLLVPEVNGRLLADLPLSHRLVTGPNCVVVPLTLPLKVLQDAFGLKKVILSTYQSTSGAGLLAQQELQDQTRCSLLGVVPSISPHASLFPHPIAFNCIPQIGKPRPNGYTSEEEKIQLETRKILDLPHLSVLPTAVRVPTLIGHAQSVYVQCEQPIDQAIFLENLLSFPGICLMDDLEQSYYPMGAVHSGTDPVYIGRIRTDEGDSTSLCFWVVADNLRKGAALNAIQIAEEILKRRPL